MLICRRGFKGAQQQLEGAIHVAHGHKLGQTQFGTCLCQAHERQQLPWESCYAPAAQVRLAPEAQVVVSELVCRFFG